MTSKGKIKTETTSPAVMKNPFANFFKAHLLQRLDNSPPRGKYETASLVQA
jgi:hypothetical protein